MDDTDNEPLWASIIRLQIGSPNPEPFFLYDTSGKNISFNCSSVIPQPLSFITIVIRLFWDDMEMLILPFCVGTIASEAFLIRFIKA